MTPQTPALPLEILVSLPGMTRHLAVIRTLVVPGLRFLITFSFDQEFVIYPKLVMPFPVTNAWIYALRFDLISCSKAVMFG